MKPAPSPRVSPVEADIGAHGSGSSAPRAEKPYAESWASGSTPPQMT